MAIRVLCPGRNPCIGSPWRTYRCHSQLLNFAPSLSYALICSYGSAASKTFTRGAPSTFSSDLVGVVLGPMMRFSTIKAGLWPLAWASVATVGSFASAQQASTSTSAPAWPFQTFLSEPALHPTVVKTTVTGRPSSEYLFLGTDGMLVALNAGPMIADEDGEPVYLGRGAAMGFGKQQYKQESVLAWWNGTTIPDPVGRGFGYILIADKSYKVIANITLPGNFLSLNASQTYDSNIDLHEIYITDRDTVVVTANNVTTANLTSVGGPETGWVVDSQMYEIDIETNRILYSWKSLEHLDQIPFSNSLDPLGAQGFNGASQSLAWPYFHINAASVFEDGYLISSPSFYAVFAIDKSGDVKWTVQGSTGGDFELASDAHFSYQHDVRVLSMQGSEVILGMHDNANSPLTLKNETTPTSGLILKLDMKGHTAVAVKRYENPRNPLYVTAQGSFQVLPNGNVFMGHGLVPEMEEFTSDGRIVATTQFGSVVNGVSAPPGAALSYRAFKWTWTGCPSAPPAVAAQHEGGQLKIAMSWNGATDISGWKVFAGDSSNKLRQVAFVPKKGFETTLLIKSAHYVQVEAIGCDQCGSHAPRKSSTIAVK